MKRITQTIAATVSSSYSTSGIQYLVETETGRIFAVYIDPASDISYRWSDDGGVTWSDSTSLFVGTVVQLAVWYDGWSGLSSGLIHVAYTESVGHDTHYKAIRATTDTTPGHTNSVVIFAGVSVAGASGMLSITRARGGNVYCRMIIDNGTEGGFYRLPNANVTSSGTPGAWDAARTINEANASGDMMILVPGFAADDQDIMGIFWDVSANQLSRQTYDDSANSWSETVWTSATELVASTAFPNFAAAVDLANSQIVAIAWNAVDAANQDLIGATITESAITSFNAPVANATDDCGLCAIGIDTLTGYWYVVYCGKEDGSETWLTSVNQYYKVSTDGGSTWGDETKLTDIATDTRQLLMTPRFGFGRFVTMAWVNLTMDELWVNAPLTRSVRAAEMVVYASH